MLTTTERPGTQAQVLTTESTRGTAVVVGLLFLFATASFIGANAFTTDALGQVDLLGAGSAPGAGSGASLATGALLLAGQFGVVGIAVLLFPVLKTHGEALALGHVGFRVGELAASLFYLSVPLLLIQLRASVAAGSVDASASTALAALLRAQYDVAILLVYLVTAAAGMCMAVLLHRSRVVPRWLAVLGLVTYPTLLLGCVLDVYGVVDVTQGVGLLALLPGAVFELVLPPWLIVMGFRFPAAS